MSNRFDDLVREPANDEQAGSVMSASNWEAPTPGTAADTAKPHWSKRKAGPLPVWGWIASGMVLVGIIGAFTDQSDNDETSIPITVETTTAPERTPTESDSQWAAREIAAAYLEHSDFSREMLIDQLKREGLSTEDATYGVDAQNADWFAQAVKAVEHYREHTVLNRSGLIWQLEHDGFTSEQAVHGVNAVGLS